MASALYEPWLKERDEEVVSALSKEEVECRMVHSYCLREPYSVSTQGVGLRGRSTLHTHGSPGGLHVVVLLALACVAWPNGQSLNELAYDMCCSPDLSWFLLCL